MLEWARGIGSYLLIVVLLCWPAHVGAVLAARGLGCRFRWFDGRPASPSAWRGAAIRLLSWLAVWPVILALLMLGLFEQGDLVPSTRVEVMSRGPAAAAGLRDGDRIARIDGRQIASFEDLRHDISRTPATRKLTIERDGQPLTLDVTPIDRRIGVTSIVERYPMSVSRAFSRALPALAEPVAHLRVLAHAAFNPGKQRTELSGMIGIVVRATRDYSGSYLLILGMLSARLVPMILGVHLFDALTLWLFRATHAWARNDAHTDEDARLARRHQTLWLCALLYLVYSGLRLLHETALGDATLIGIELLMPGAIAGTVLVAIVGCQRWGAVRAILVVAVCMSLPGVTLLALAWLAWSVRKELERQGFRISGLVARPAAAEHA